LFGKIRSGGFINRGADSGDVEFRLDVTHLPDLPPISFDELKRELNRQQVLDSLDAMYRFPIAQALVAREYAVIRQAAEAELSADPTEQAELASMSNEIRRERRDAETLAQTRDRLIEDRLIELITRTEEPPKDPPD